MTLPSFEQPAPLNNCCGSVSADLKGGQFSRCRGEPESLPVVAEHTNAAAAVGDRQSRLRVFSQPVMVSS